MIILLTCRIFNSISVNLTYQYNFSIQDDSASITSILSFNNLLIKLKLIKFLNIPTLMTMFFQIIEFFCTT